MAVVVNLATIGMGRFFGSAYSFELYALTDSRLLQTGLFWLLPASLLIALAGARRGLETRLVLTCCGGALVALLAVGNRGSGITFAAAALIVWTYTRGSVSLRTAGVAGLSLLFLLPTVAAVRRLPRNAVRLEDLTAAAAEATPLQALAETGASLRPLVETLRLVPAEVPYRLGRSYLSAALRLVPNAGIDRSEQEGADPADLPPNHWITYTVAPWTYASFGGLGFSGIAEPYLNFGVLGVAIYFLGLGLCFGRAERALASGAPRRTVALAAVVFMPLLLTVRNDFHNFVRPAVWGVCVVLLIERIHGVRRVARAARPVLGPARPPPTRIAHTAP